MNSRILNLHIKIWSFLIRGGPRFRVSTEEFLKSGHNLTPKKSQAGRKAQHTTVTHPSSSYAGSWFWRTGTFGPHHRLTWQDVAEGFRAVEFATGKKSGRGRPYKRLKDSVKGYLNQCASQGLCERLSQPVWHQTRPDWIRGFGLIHWRSLIPKALTHFKEDKMPVQSCR